MFVLIVAVPALLVVVTGYVLGHAAWTWLAGALVGTGGAEAGAEPAGWVTGVLLLVAVGWLLVRRRRARRRG